MTTEAIVCGSSTTAIAMASELERLAVGDDFVPDVGFLRRDDYTRSFAAVRFSPRPKSTSSVRQFTYRAFYDFYENGNGRMETQDVSAEFGAEYHNGDALSVQASRLYEFLEQPFRIAPDVAIAPGGYPFTEAESGLYPRRQAPIIGEIRRSGRHVLQRKQEDR